MKIANQQIQNSNLGSLLFKNVQNAYQQNDKKLHEYQQYFSEQYQIKISQEKELQNIFLQQQEIESKLQQLISNIQQQMNMIPNEQYKPILGIDFGTSRCTIGYYSINKGGIGKLEIVSNLNGLSSIK